jgi:hypothetical protein
MPIAVASFEALDSYGDLIAVNKGEWVIDGHELVLSHPRMFTGIAPSTPRGVGRKNGARRGTGGSVATRPAGRTNKVVFTGYAWEDLEREVLEWCDGLEGGGALYGNVERDGTIVVAQVTGCGLDTERTPTSICMDRDRFLSFERPGAVWCGDWHSHDARSPRPSASDERGWKASVRAGLDVYAGVIVTPRDVEDWRWANPNIADWVAHRDGAIGLATVERS